MYEIITIKEKSKKKMPKKRIWRTWQKILLGIGIGMFVILFSGALAVITMGMKAKDDLKSAEQFITYNGKKYKYRKDVVNILCLGIDKAEQMAYMEEGRGCFGMSDAILLVSIDMKEHALSVISIPRDTMAEVQMTLEDGTLGQKQNMQLCYQYAFGKSMEQSNELTTEAVSRLLYNIQIQRSCAINFEAVPFLNDAVGGVDVIIQEDGMDVWKPELFKYGEKMHLDGDLALRFIRTRNKNRADGATLRADRQKQYALAFVEKAKSVVLRNPLIPLKIFWGLQKDGNMCTDITVEDIVYLMPEVLRVSFSGDMMQVLPGEVSVGENGYAEYRIDVDAVKELIINTFYEEV